MDYIKIRGAREHNLKNVDLDIPKNKLIVVTGLSGSGKSSLAFDTLYAEGQRRYVESLSVYARQFVDLMKKPDVDLIEGLSPAISIEQKTTSHNPRSIVGTVTEIYDYMRLLWARVAFRIRRQQACRLKVKPLRRWLTALWLCPKGQSCCCFPPLCAAEKANIKRNQGISEKGFQRLKIDGTVYNIEETPELNKSFKHDLSVVVDRVVIKPGMESRLAESFETALGLSDGLAVAENAETHEEMMFSSRYACPVSGFTIEEIEPRLFSFNNPHGFCPECEGLGVKLYVDPELVIPDKTKRLDEGAIAPWSGANGEIYPWHREALQGLSRRFHLDLSSRWCDLPKETQHAILFGNMSFEGVIPNLNRRFLETDSEYMREEIQKFQNNIVCEHCGGKRLRPEALAVKIDGKDIADITNMSIAEAREWFGSIAGRLKPQNREVAERILRETNERLDFLINVGLGYLSLGRSSGTLSGGESQRIRLASQIGSGLTGVLYVLDEPSIGLHQRDNDRLLSTLFRLRDLGNTVIVVEHDEDAMRAADMLIDMGPAAGSLGGSVIAAGTPQEVAENLNSLTGRYLAGTKRFPSRLSAAKETENH